MALFPRSRRGDRARRREDDGIHAITFDLESFEFVRASDDVGLLRVGGRWIAPVSRALGEIVLSVRRDGETLVLTPLPDMIGAAPVASPAGEEWRGAFTMTVEVADDPRTEFALHAGDDARAALPRPSEWAALQSEDEADDAEAESPVVAELVARLDEVARLEEAAASESQPEPREVAAEVAPVPEPASEHEPAAVAVEPAPVPAEPAPVEPAPAGDEVARLRAELAAVQAELEVERRRREALAAELSSHASVEEDLRNAIAMQEAEMASAVAQATRAAEAKRRRGLAPARERDDHSESPRPRPADEEFIARIERARRASEAAPG